MRRPRAEKGKPARARKIGPYITALKRDNKSCSAARATKKRAGFERRNQSGADLARAARRIASRAPRQRNARSKPFVRAPTRKGFNLRAPPFLRPDFFSSFSLIGFSRGRGGVYISVDAGDNGFSVRIMRQSLLSCGGF